MAAGKKLESPFGHVTQREWDGLIARGADLEHVGMFALLRVRADRDGVTRDTLATLGRWANRSDDTVSNLLAWLKRAGVITSDRKSIKGGQRGLAFVQERKALPLEEWDEHRESSGLIEVMSTERERDSSTMSTEESPDEHRRTEGRAPRTAGYNPDVPQRKPQTREARRGSPSEDPREVGTGRLAEAEALGLVNITTILARSHHAASFEGKLTELADLVIRHQDRDIEQACNDLIEKVDVIKYDSKAISLLESFIEKAPRVAPRERDLTPDEARARPRVFPSVDEQLAAMKRRDRARLSAHSVALAASQKAPVAS